MNMRPIAGFTLMELMIVVAIVGVLAAIAYPSYSRWAIEARRSDAHIALTRTAADMEKFFAECGQYASTLGGSRKCTDANPGLGYTDSFSPEKYYSLAVTLSSGSFTLTATPRGGMAQANDKNCTTLTLDGKGAKNATGTETSRCWRK